MAYKYIDVSRYNGTIDWDRVKAAGIHGAFLKTVSTNSSFGGLYIDPTFERNYAECKRVGMPVGVYYYTYATDISYRNKELALFKQAVTGKKFELPLVVDVEDNLLKPLSKDALTDLVIHRLDEIESWGAYRMLYSYLNYEATELDMDRLAKYDHWLAAYIKNKPAGTYSIWQYSSNGNVPGVTGRCDVNHVYKDFPTIISAAGLNDFTNGVVDPEKVTPIASSPIRMVIGPGSDDELKPVCDLLNDLLIEYETADGFIYTEKVSAGDQVSIIKKAKKLEVKEYVPIIIHDNSMLDIDEPGVDIEPEPITPPEDPIKKSFLVRLLEFFMRLFGGK